MKPSDDVLKRLDVPDERQLSAERKAALKEDVLQRIGQPGRSGDERFSALRRRVLIPVLAAVVAGALLGSLTTAYAMGDPDAPSASPESLSTISNAGTPVALTRQYKGLPSTGQAFLMATRGSTAYLHVPLTDGQTCFFTGRAAKRGTFDLGSGGCWTPEARFPILDRSGIQVDGPGGFKVLSVQGFAADGVATIALEDLEGRTIAESAVRDNVYKLTAYPPGGVSALVARDSGGHELQRIRYTR
jgi:hypothetical protein